eukprot:TRINITY_DN16432_c0_g1_i1.p1 TRINITY_DN16432_c0_g1~~TRINITY_DN16432_c0_g1_i1.p1  ORF type:complete len:541 (-),score=102.83 TRINITY_DN16432_c0_g1_i1:202-1824(-)
MSSSPQNSRCSSDGVDAPSHEVQDAESNLVVDEVHSLPYQEVHVTSRASYRSILKRFNTLGVCSTLNVVRLQHRLWKDYIAIAATEGLHGVVCVHNQQKDQTMTLHVFKELPNMEEYNVSAMSREDLAWARRGASLLASAPVVRLRVGQSAEARVLETLATEPHVASHEVDAISTRAAWEAVCCAIPASLVTHVEAPPPVPDAVRSRREALPIRAARPSITSAVVANQITIIAGPPGCGKTTQIPQYILEDEICGPSQCVLMVQPCNVLAPFVAQKVAREMGGVEVGGPFVGFQLPFVSAVCPETRLRITTASYLLLLLQADPTLAGVAVVVADELEMRTAAQDMAMVALRDLARRRSDVKLVLITGPEEADSLAAAMATTPDLVGEPERLEEDEEVVRQRTFETLDIAAARVSKLPETRDETPTTLEGAAAGNQASVGEDQKEMDQSRGCSPEMAPERESDDRDDDAQETLPENHPDETGVNSDTCLMNEAAEDEDQWELRPPYPTLAMNVEIVTVQFPSGQPNIHYLEDALTWTSCEI